jgi:hypothetical protein
VAVVQITTEMVNLAAQAVGQGTPVDLMVVLEHLDKDLLVVL